MNVEAINLKKISMIGTIIISLILGGTAHLKSSYIDNESSRLREDIRELQVKVARNEAEILLLPPIKLLNRLDRLEDILDKLKTLLYEHQINHKNLKSQSLGGPK
jgi:hypothetical protein